MLVGIHQHRVAVSLGHGNGNDFIGKVLALERQPRGPLALSSEGALILTGHTEAFRHHFGGAAHVLIGERAPQAIRDEGVA